MVAENNLMLVRSDVISVATFDAAAHAAYLEEKRDIIRAICLPEQFRRDDALLGLVIEIGKLRGLNPIAKQMWVVPRGGKPSIETSIDGYRLIASRTGCYAGSDEPVYDIEDAEHPGRCTVTVWKIVHGDRYPFTATVRWSEFGVQGWTAKYDNLWKTKPYHMLGVRAEVHALKKAFPEETSGLSVDDDTIDAPDAGNGNREIKKAGVPVSVPRPPSGGSSRQALKASVQRQPAPEKPPMDAESPEEPASPDRDVLMAEVRALGTRGFDLEAYLKRAHPDTDLSELTDAELVQAAEVGRRVAKK
jgi:phage recombination protein Bet